MRGDATKLPIVMLGVLCAIGVHFPTSAQEVVTFVGGTGATTTSQQSWTQPGNWSSGSIPCSPTVWPQINPQGSAGSTLRILYSSTSLGGLTGTTNVLNVGAMTFPQTLVSASTTYAIQNNGTSAGTKGTLRFYGIDTTIGGQPRRIILDNSTTLSDVAFTQTNQGQQFELRTSGAINVAANTQLSLATMILQDGTARGITKVGDGVLSFAGTGNESQLSTYSGGFTMEGGVVQWALSGTTQICTPFGLGALTLRSGTLRSSGSSGRSINVSVVLDGTTTLGSALPGFSGSITVNSAGGSLATTIPRSSVLSVADGGSVTWHQATSGSGGLTKAGGGALRLSGIGGTLAHSGSTIVQSGTLAIDGRLTNSAAVSVLAGATLQGTGTISGPTTIAADATISPGAGPGTLSVGAITWNGASNYNWQMLSGSGVAGAAGTWDFVNASGTLAIAATSATPVRLNLWTLSGTNPDVSGTASNFNASQQSSIWPIAFAGGGISGFAANKFLINTSATNGTGGFANDLAGGSFSVAQLGNKMLALVFTSTAAAPSIVIDVASGTQTQAQAGWPVLGGGYPVVKTGSGTLVVDQVNSLTGSTTVQGGGLQLANAAALASSTLVPRAGGAVTLTPYLQTAVGGLKPDQGGIVDVGSGMVTVAAGLSATDMVAALLAGMGDGSWNGGSGITSGVAAASGGARTVGWLDNGDGSVTFGFAAAGDTNLDWQVDILDSANFLSSGKLDSGLPASWNEGDFTYDGFVDVLDAAAFLSTGLLDAGAYNPPPNQVGGVAAVPEPLTSPLLLWGGAVVAGGVIRGRRFAGRRSSGE